LLLARFGQHLAAKVSQNPFGVRSTKVFLQPLFVFAGIGRVSTLLHDR
jgi:hypothetical protein